MYCTWKTCPIQLGHKSIRFLYTFVALSASSSDSVSSFVCSVKIRIADLESVLMTARDDLLLCLTSALLSFSIVGRVNEISLFYLI